MAETIVEAYEKVFDEHGNVRACGRGPCQILIEACEDKEPYTYFGDKITGRMRIEAIKELYEEEKSK